MSKHTKELSRRNFLKGATYTSALSIGGLSSVAFAACGNKPSLTSASSSLTLFNQSDKTVALDASQPVNLETMNGWVVIKINKASDQDIANLRVDKIITLRSGQKQSFTVDSGLSPMLKEAGDFIVITNEYSASNNMIPVSIHDSLVA